MAIAAEDIHGTMPFDAAFGDDGSAGRRTDRTPPATPISRARFLDHVDASVRYLAAWLGGVANGQIADAPIAEESRAQLWQWLHAGGAALDDGTPIDFALFDGAVQRVGERLPRRGLPGQDKLMQAAWLLAELTHARTFAEIPVQARAL